MLLKFLLPIFNLIKLLVLISTMVFANFEPCVLVYNSPLLINQIVRWHNEYYFLSKIWNLHLFLILNLLICKLLNLFTFIVVVLYNHNSNLCFSTACIHEYYCTMLIWVFLIIKQVINFVNNVLLVNVNLSNFFFLCFIGNYI